MKVTPAIINAEFIGTWARVARSTNPSCRGISGTVTNETRNTLTLLRDGQSRILSKSDNVFHFTFPDETVVAIEGSLLLGRPEDRLKKHIRRLW
jgi:ribonuclease P protein subunit POP4